MPLSLRKVEPTYVSRGTLPEKISVPNDLEAVANGSLSHVILQLSSLSQHAEEIFTDLVRVATDISSRSVNLQGRLDRLAVKVNQLDGAQEEASNSMQDCLNTKPFQSSTAFDQQVVSRASMSNGMLQKHAKCDRPPPLEKLNPYRDDGKDGLKFYTDPSYFFDLWRQEMLKDTEKAVRKLNKPHKKDGGRIKKVRQPQKTRDKHVDIAIQRGEHIIPTSQVYSPTGGQGAPRPMDIGDGIIYPEMPKKSSRPASGEIKHVSFDGVDSPEERHKHERGLENHRFAIHANNYHRSMSYDEYYQNDNKQVQRQVSLPAYETPELIMKLHDNPAKHDNHAAAPPNAYGYQHYNGHAPMSNNPNKLPLGPVLSNGRRSSESSDSSSNRVPGFAYSRPTQPPPAPPTQTSQMGTPTSVSSGTPMGRGASRTSNARDTLPPPPPPPSEDGVVTNGGEMVNGLPNNNGNYPFPPPSSQQDRMSQMPPPPAMDENEEDLPPPPPTPDQVQPDQQSGAALPRPHGILKQPTLTTTTDEVLPPAPPPPPPESNSPVPPPPPPPLMVDLVESPTKTPNGNVGVTKAKRVIPPPEVDTRSELLSAIRGGIRLKKVERVIAVKEDKTSTTYCDVAAILSRRVALEMSDSDSDSSEHSSGEWDETSA